MKTMHSVRWNLLLIAPILFISLSQPGCNKAEEENSSVSPASVGKAPQGQPAMAQATSATMPPAQSVSGQAPIQSAGQDDSASLTISNTNTTQGQPVITQPAAIAQGQPAPTAPNASAQVSQSSPSQPHSRTMEEMHRDKAGL